MAEGKLSGANTLILNEATMIEAVQLLLDRQCTVPGALGNVRSVSFEAGPANTRRFQIEVVVTPKPNNALEPR